MKLKVTSDPVDLIGALIDKVNDFNLHHGIQNSLDAKLDAARKSLVDLKTNNDISAIKALEAFVCSVVAQRGKKIPEADADMFISDAKEIIDLLNQEIGNIP